jgi:structural maintenance of chromosome 1
MCIIGPNGAGKSNLMDAISFVLGTQLKDLVYRGRKAARGPDEESLDVDEPETQDSQIAPDARTAYVTAVYEDENAKEWLFKRR